MTSERCKHNLANGECWLCNGNKPTAHYLVRDILDFGRPPDFDRFPKGGWTSMYAIDFDHHGDEIQEESGSLL